MSSLMKLILSILLFQSIFSLKLQLIDEDYVKVQIGYPPKEYKLIVDPVSPITYLFKENPSQTKMEGELNKQITFSNVFGNFTGVWKNDFFYLTDDRLMNFRMDYVEITKKDSKLLCDGVLGIGYSFENSYGNIYEVLEKMYNAFPSKKVFSYDKKKMQITLGEFPERSNYNPTVLKIYEKKETPGIFTKLDKLRFMTDYDQTKYISEEDINDDALLTLLPVIIAPKHRLKNLYTNYTTLFGTSKSTFSKKGENVNVTKFYTDFYLTVLTEWLINSDALKKNKENSDQKSDSEMIKITCLNIGSLVLMSLELIDSISISKIILLNYIVNLLMILPKVNHNY